MSRKNQQGVTAEDNALWTLKSTHAYLMLLEEHVRKNHEVNPKQKDVKVMTDKLLSTCYKRYYVGQLNQNTLGWLLTITYL